jgi:hypothetical protein
MKRTYVLAHAMARQRALDDLRTAPDGYVVTIGEATRSAEQNAAQWPYLAGFAAQKQLCINGVMQWVTDEDWKDVLTACWNGEMRMAVFDGKVIMLPQRTHTMGKKVFSTWMEFLVSIAAQAGIEPIYKSPPRLKLA